MLLTKEDLNMDNYEFNQMVQESILKILSHNKFTLLGLSDFQSYEPLKWIQAQIIVYNLNRLVNQYKVERVIENNAGKRAYYGYISPRRSAKLVAKTEKIHTTEKYRYEMFIEKNKKNGLTF